MLFPPFTCSDGLAGQVAAVHGQFVKAVEELFERHKGAAGFKDTELLVY